MINKNLLGENCLAGNCKKYCLIRFVDIYNFYKKTKQLKNEMKEDT